MASHGARADPDLSDHLLVSVLAEIRRLGGVARTEELARVGIGPGLLRIATANGEVVRPRKGWYVDPALGDEVVAAVRVGGALACSSALRRRGVWVPDDAAPHVSVPAGSSRLRSPRGSKVQLDASDAVVVHWSHAPTRGVESVGRALAALIACLGPELGFAAAESALHIGAIELATARSRFLGDARWMRQHLGRLSESGTESLLKLILIGLGIAFVQQASVPGVGRVDFLIGRLIIEVDSKAWHTDVHRDRAHDAAASARGYRTLRFDFAQIVHARDAVEAAIVGALIRGDLA